MKIAILGAGLEGKSLEKYFSKKENILCDVLDQKENPHAFDHLDQYDFVYRSPGIPLRSDFLNPVRAKLKTATQEFFDVCPAKIIGITGTKGKGTCSTLIAKGLALAGKKVHLLGNIGAPALDELDHIQKDDFVVFELSSFQLEDLHKSPHLSVVLNISMDHLDHHGNIENYRTAKRAIVAHQTQEDFAWINADYFGSFDMGRFGFGQKTMYSTKSQSKVCLHEEDGEKYISIAGEKVVPISIINIRGPHHLENILPAVAVLKHLGVENQTIRELLENFEGLEFRLQKVHEACGVSYFNDSISTNPETVLAAVRSFTEPIVLMLGGKNKGLSFENLIEELEKTKNLKKILLFGELGAELKNAFHQKESIYEKDIEKLLESQKKGFHNGDVVVFSPGGTSFDAYENYKQRGEHFNEIVRRFS